MDQLMAALRAVAEPTRLRLLALCALRDLNVSELVHILGQSQPRISRHLKILCDAGVLTRHAEGAWVFHRLAGTATARRLVALIPDRDPALDSDRRRLAEVNAERARAAAAYFEENAESWNQIRALHADEGEVESALLVALGPERVLDHLDLGTGTGRILQVLAGQVDRAVGVDQSRHMLAVARANLDRAGLKNCSVRQGDMYQLDVPAQSIALVTLHQVLHFADDPGRVIAEAARVLRPGGRLAMVDFAPHVRDDLRTEHRHRRLGLSSDEIEAWCASAGLILSKSRPLPGDPLTVMVWVALKPPPERSLTTNAPIIKTNHLLK